MKKALLIGLAGAACLLAQRGPGFGPGPGGPMGRQGGPGSPEMRNPVAGAPYSGTETTVTTQTLANGNTIQHQSSTTFYRDSAGRTRTETTRPVRPGATGVQSCASLTPCTAPQLTVVTIHDPVAGVIRSLDTANKVSHEMVVRRPNQNGTQQGTGAGPQGRRQGAGARPGFQGDVAVRGARANDPNMVTETLGGQSINGVYATGTRVTRTIPAGAQGNSQPMQIVHETWVSTDLKVPVMTKTTDPLRGTTVRQLTNINRSEPDATLFQTPAGYTTRSGGPSGPGGPGRRGPGGPGGQIR